MLHLAYDSNLMKLCKVYLRVFLCFGGRWCIASSIIQHYSTPQFTKYSTYYSLQLQEWKVRWMIGFCRFGLSLFGFINQNFFVWIYVILGGQCLSCSSIQHKNFIFSNDSSIHFYDLWNQFSTTAPTVQSNLKNLKFHRIPSLVQIDLQALVLNSCKSASYYLSHQSDYNL